MISTSMTLRKMQFTCSTDATDKLSTRLFPGVREKISYQDVLSALKSNHPQSGSPKVVYIRDCFDWFFYRVDRIEHYIRRKLIDFVDVETVFKTYAKQIKQNQEIYDEFLSFHGYDLAKHFFTHYK